MPASPDVCWVGASRKKYGYWSRPLPYACKPGDHGNFIFCKLINDEWVPVYIGHGELKSRLSDPAHYGYAVRKGATHVHVRMNSMEQARIEEAQDLLEGYPEAGKQEGCC